MYKVVLADTLLNLSDLFFEISNLWYFMIGHELEQFGEKLTFLRGVDRYSCFFLNFGICKNRLTTFSVRQHETLKWRFLQILFLQTEKTY